MDIAKPIITGNDVWASNSGPDDILIPYDKVSGGWGYANKPSYQHLNWFWNTISGFFVHLNENGVPVWDSESVYESSGLVKHTGFIYQAFSKNKDIRPDLSSRVWSGLEFMNGLVDVEIDQSTQDDLLIGQYGAWTNESIKNSINVNFEQLQNTEITAHLETVIAYGAGSSGDTWKNVEVRDAFKDKIKIEDFENVRIDRPIPSEVLSFQETEVYYQPDNIWRQEYRWVNTYNRGKVNWNTVPDIPDEFPPRPAARDAVGGVRMWVADDAQGEQSLFIENTLLDPVPAPFDLTATTDSDVNIKLTWTGTILAAQYYVYRDGVKISTTNPVTDTSFEDLPGDNEYHVYYITAVDGSPQENESYPSNYAIGVVRP